MNFETHHRIRSSSDLRAYALISTLLILSLILMVVVALLGLQRRSNSRVALDRDLTEARANALYALDTALSELQRYAGPDQAVSATADILETEGNPIPNPKWTGIWPATEEARSNDSLGAFLVSGNERFDVDESLTAYPSGYHDPNVELSPNSTDIIELVGAGMKHPENRVLVPRQALHEPFGERRLKGHFAYWVGDEGVKAKVNLLDPYRNPENNEEKTLRLTIAQRNGIEAVLPTFNSNDSRNGETTTTAEFGLLQESGVELAPYFHDLTTHSTGLLTDTRHGGLRRDLTSAFESNRIFAREFAATPTFATPSASVTEIDQYRLDTGRLKDFYLVDEILETSLKNDASRGRWSGGPNWANLREYYLLKNRPVQNIPFLPHPRCGVAMREYAFNPYKHGTVVGTGAINQSGKKDYYQRNSPVSPILARAQMNVRLRTRENPRKGDEPPTYRLELEIQPVIGIWNPYNIAMSNRKYRFDWEISVFLIIEVDGKKFFYDLYRLWNSPSEPWFSMDSTSIDLEPGEIRLLSVESRNPLLRTVTLSPRWNGEGCFWKTLPVDQTDPKSKPLTLEADASVNVVKVGLVAPPETSKWDEEKKEFEKHNTFMAIKYGEQVGSSGNNVESSSVRMNNLWKADDTSGPQFVPLPDDEVPPFYPPQHTDDPLRLAAWVYYLRTTQEDDLGHRNFIDSNVRAIVANSRWDGSIADRGWRAMGWLADGGNRALLPTGNEEPEADGQGRYRGFGGNSIGATGETHLVLFDVPREPLLSIGQLQNANLGRYNNEPSFIVGNSYQNVRIPLGQTIVRNFAPYLPGLDVFDLSWHVNHRLWDSYFFSGIEPGKASDVISGAKDGEPLPESRYHLYDPDDQFEERIQSAENAEDSYDAIAANLLVDGAFNVNSTSVGAWKAMLSSMRNLEIPVYDPTTATHRWVPGKIVFSRFTRPFDEGFDSTASATNDNYWRGYRELTEEQITEVAEEIVRQIKMRGPFRSLGDFVNRSLEDTDPSNAPEDDTRICGALQAALDRTSVNRDISSSLSQPVDPIPDSANEFYDVPEASTQGTGFPGYLLQGDVLQALGPVLTARSDTFRIRAYGDKTATSRQDPNLEITTARAWCEAIVQRVPEPVEKLSDDSTEEEDLIQRPEDVETHYRSAEKPYFGRRFQIVSFRWLEKDEL
ncbi:MAG: hypothetical protein KDN19_06260 [Verrucomicrobiae bacterium]|nr:hypothetical protein [Verrucomicrobiae bacterium]